MLETIVSMCIDSKADAEDMRIASRAFAYCPIKIFQISDPQILNKQIKRFTEDSSFTIENFFRAILNILNTFG